jgi:hypothetical protein
MKKILIFCFIINNIISLFADGTPERDRLAYNQIQLKVVNLTDRTINFYFNKLYGTWGYDRWQIRSGEEFVTMNTPVNDDYPGFIGIQYNTAPGHQTNEVNPIIIYKYSFVPFTRRDRVKKQFFVLVMDSEVQFIEGNIDEKTDYFEKSLYQNRLTDSYWYKVNLGQGFVELKIENNSGSVKIIRVTTVLENQREITIGNRMAETYTIDYQLYLFGGINIEVSDNGSTYDIINLRISWLKNYARINQIILRLKSDGHELAYN